MLSRAILEIITATLDLDKTNKNEEIITAASRFGTVKTKLLEIRKEDIRIGKERRRERYIFSLLNEGSVNTSVITKAINRPMFVASIGNNILRIIDDQCICT